MNDDQKDDKMRLVPATPRGLAAGSANLVRRGLAALAASPPRTLVFPESKSIGYLSVYAANATSLDIFEHYIDWPEGDYEEKKEAEYDTKGVITIPKGKTLHLEIYDLSVNAPILSDLIKNVDGLYFSDFRYFPPSEHFDDMSHIKWLGIGEHFPGRDSEEPWFGDLSKLSQLRGLYLCSCILKHVELATLRKHHQLDYLDLADTGIDDAQLHHLEELQQMRVLDLGSNENIYGNGFERIKEMPCLESLNLSGTNTVNVSLQHLTNLRQLKYLGLSNTQITDEGWHIYKK